MFLKHVYGVLITSIIITHLYVVTGIGDLSLTSDLRNNSAGYIPTNNSMGRKKMNISLNATGVETQKVNANAIICDDDDGDDDCGDDDDYETEDPCTSSTTCQTETTASKCTVCATTNPCPCEDDYEMEDPCTSSTSCQTETTVSKCTVCATTIPCPCDDDDDDNYEMEDPCTSSTSCQNQRKTTVTECTDFSKQTNTCICNNNNDYFDEASTRNFDSNTSKAEKDRQIRANDNAEGNSNTSKAEKDRQIRANDNAEGNSNTFKAEKDRQIRADDNAEDDDNFGKYFLGMQEFTTENQKLNEMSIKERLTQIKVLLQELEKRLVTPSDRLVEPITKPFYSGKNKNIYDKTTPRVKGNGTWRLGKGKHFTQKVVEPTENTFHNGKNENIYDKSTPRLDENGIWRLGKQLKQKLNTKGSWIYEPEKGIFLVDDKILDELLQAVNKECKIENKYSEDKSSANKESPEIDEKVRE